MKKYSFLTALSVTTAAAISIAGCSAAPSETTPTSTPGDNPATTLTLHHVSAESSPWHACGYAEFEKVVEAADVNVDVEVFSAATTYPDIIAMLDAMDVGEIDATTPSAAQLATRYPRVAVFDAAYVFDDWESLEAAQNSEVAKELWDEIANETGIRVLGIGYYGTRHVTSNFPISHPDDLEGVKMRVVDAPLWLANGRALGASPTPVAFAELYQALQSGVVDAQENPLPVIDTQGFAEVQDYVNLTGHSVASATIAFRQEFLDGLTDAQRAAVQEGVDAAVAGATRCTLEQEEELLKKWSQADSIIEINDDVDRAAFREKAKAELIAEFGDEWGDLYEQFSQL